jgi:lipopolysaccharide export system permease protein
MLTVTAIVLVISMGWRFSGYLNEAANGTLSKDVLFYLIVFRIPRFLELIIPVSFFLSIMLVYGRMYVDSEMVVLESCGLSPLRLAGITLSLSLVVMFLAGGVTLWLKPISEGSVEELFAGQRNLTEFDTLAPGRFQKLRSGKRVTYVEDFTDEGKLSKVFINEYKESNFYGPKDVNTVVSETGETQVDENGNRFLVLNDGYRYSGAPGQKSYQVVRYEEYGQRIEKEVAEKRRPRNSSFDMAELMASSEPKDVAEWQWRVSMIIMIPIIALMALPLSKVNPRQGRFTRLVPGMILCFLYVIALSSVRSSLGRGNLPADVGIWWVHGIFVVVIGFLYRLDWLSATALRIFDKVRSA